MTDRGKNQTFGIYFSISQRPDRQRGMYAPSVSIMNDDISALMLYVLTDPS